MREPSLLWSHLILFNRFWWLWKSFLLLFLIVSGLFFNWHDISLIPSLIISSWRYGWCLRRRKWFWIWSYSASIFFLMLVIRLGDISSPCICIFQLFLQINTVSHWNLSWIKTIWTSRMVGIDRLWGFVVHTRNTRFRLFPHKPFIRHRSHAYLQCFTIVLIYWTDIISSYLWSIVICNRLGCLVGIVV
jgi:hypothetical protein